ncbi:hypothetical protein LXA47_31270 [Massilia sp. P8910]|uniref:hypothetical protein n=1 Tax=Massilia antarctica TaxID=2765360 RepID=UPI001E53004F|nr:hypothetical protein [Massilia antarctica]MCE3608052.1 hypothetical protein [Massilia antarctica]
MSAADTHFGMHMLAESLGSFLAIELYDFESEPIAMPEPPDYEEDDDLAEFVAAAYAWGAQS